MDQFRGYTVVGMLLVNYLGSFAACPRILKHTHDYVSYADTIMPQFLFAVGFAMRLTFGRRMQTQGSSAAYWRMIKRLFGLVLVSLVVYTVGRRADTWQELTEIGFWGAVSEPLKRGWFQTLMHIAVTSLWLIPVVHGKAAVRVAWLIGSAAAHVVLSYWFNFTWVNTSPNAIDGGPLGFLTWAVPAVMGTLACDIFVRPRDELRWNSPFLARTVGLSFLIMALGYAMSCGTRFYDVAVDQRELAAGEKLAANPVWPSSDQIQSKFSESGFSSLLAEPPFVPPPSVEERKWNYWMMSQRAGTLSYLTFAAGFSLLVYVVFFVICDMWGWRLAFFHTFGTNALLAYVLHSMVASAVKPFVPNDSPGWYVTSSLFVFFWITWLFIRSFEKQGMFLRV